MLFLENPPPDLYTGIKRYATLVKKRAEDQIHKLGKETSLLLEKVVWKLLIGTELDQEENRVLW